MTAKLEFVHQCNANLTPLDNPRACGRLSVETIAAGVYLCDVHLGLAAEGGGIPIVGGGYVRRQARKVEHTSNIVDELDGDD